MNKQTRKKHQDIYKNATVQNLCTYLSSLHQLMMQLLKKSAFVPFLDSRYCTAVVVAEGELGAGSR